MCARFTLTTGPEEIAAEFELASLPDSGPRYNIAPTQRVAAVRADHQYVLLRWGLIPSWADDLKIGQRLLNARADTVATKPSFRAAYRKRRCLIPADGYFEWQAVGRQKQPYYFRLRDGALFAFAGLWEHWEREGQVIESCTIITTEANDLSRPIHDRMPVILDRAGRQRWLAPEADHLEALLRPYPADQMRFDAVNPVVNNPRNDGPECIALLAS